MLTISEPKIAGLPRRWAPFPGFSLLFDAPNNAYRPQGAAEVLDASKEDGFFAGLRGAMADLDPDRLLTSFGLCALPPSSYHVTAFDIANVADLPTCSSGSRDGLQALLAQVPSHGGLDNPMVDLAGRSTVTATNWDLQFAFDVLAIRGPLIVRLKPLDQSAFDDFVSARAELSRKIREVHGFGAGERFSPHVTLGYFANPHGAELAKGELAEWEGMLRERIGEQCLSLPTVSLHGFTSMSTFYRAVRAPRG